MITLRDYQETAATSVFDYYAQGGEGHPLIALPTGTGKSLVLAELIRRILGSWSDQRVLLLTHVKELIKQDLAALDMLWPDAPSAVYSASLNSRRIAPVTFGGVATVARAIPKFKDTNIVLIDEAHLVSPVGSTMYRTIIEELMVYNPNLKVIGTTATIYRLGQGLLTEGDDRMFTDICCDYTGLDAFNWFIEQGYLAPLIPKPMKTEFDLNGVRTLAGEYNARDLAKAVDLNEVTNEACDEMVEYGADRLSWLIFATSIEHAVHVGECLRSRGVRTGVVHSKMQDMDRDRVIQQWKDGELQAVVNQNILTTGIDHPGCDMIAVVRPTKSTSLWVQMLGRGTRPKPVGSPHSNCLVLDFARNTERLGPINDPVLPKAKGKGKGGAAPIKVCPECGTYNHAAARVCIDCGFTFPRGHGLYVQAGTSVLMAPPKIKQPQFVEVNVSNVTYKCHPRNGFSSLRVSYFTGVNRYDEYIHFERGGGLRGRALAWIKQRVDIDAQDVPRVTQEVIDIHVARMTAPKWIRVQTNLKYPEIVHYGFGERPITETPNVVDDFDDDIPF